ncbi:MAG: magnesium/cobalt transporter CorA [Candidatus Melainabacteria bacterium]|jgi:magnesium transporter
MIKVYSSNSSNPASSFGNPQSSFEIINLTSSICREIQINTKEVYWIDLEEPSDQDLETLRLEFNFPDSNIEECKNSELYPKIEDYETHLFLVTFFLTLEEEPFKAEELNIFLGANFLITIHRKRSRFIQALQKRLERNCNYLMKQGSDFLLSEILDSFAESYLKVSEGLDLKIDRLESLIFRSTHPMVANEIFELKKQILGLKRLVVPQQEILFRLSFQAHDLISEKNRLAFRNVFDHFSRLTNSIDSYRDLLMSSFEAYRSEVSNKTNEIMKVLTIFSTIMMPLTLLVGYYGMNFEVFPELKWQEGLLLVWGLFFGITLSLFAFFKWRKWI